jgi:hypothetical protein
VNNRLPMTPGRWVALAVGLPLALLAIGWTALTVVAFAGLGSYRVNLAVPAAGHTATVSVDNGEVTVVPGPAGQLRVHGILRYSLVRPHVSWHRSASGVALHASCRAPGLCLLDYAVTVPAAGRSSVSDASGDLTASGLGGTFTLNDNSGSITATRISGVPTISDQSGDITVSSLSGSRVRIIDHSGYINASGVSSRNVTATDQSGDITLVFTKVPDQVRVSDASGGVWLVLPDGPTAYRVSAHSPSGSTSVTVPRSRSSPHVISVVDASGHISISR